MKKLFALLLVALFAITLTACPPAAAPTEPAKEEAPAPAEETAPPAEEVPPPATEGGY